MTNEDAIKWLENLKQDISPLRHGDLWPYAQVIDEIIAMLKEQETTTFFLCEYQPTCKICGFKPFAGYIPTLKWVKERGFNYCPKCGRAVKWE